MDDVTNEPKDRMLAAKIVLEADKRNIDLIKLAVPKMNIHFQAKDLSDEQLQAMGQEMAKLLT